MNSTKRVNPTIPLLGHASTKSSSIDPRWMALRIVSEFRQILPNSISFNIRATLLEFVIPCRLVLKYDSISVVSIPEFVWKPVTIQWRGDDQQLSCSPWLCFDWLEVIIILLLVTIATRRHVHWRSGVVIEDSSEHSSAIATWSSFVCMPESGLSVDYCSSRWRGSSRYCSYSVHSVWWIDSMVVDGTTKISNEKSKHTLAEWGERKSTSQFITGK